MNVHSTVHAILGLVVSMLLVFRTNGAYAKWWEARSLWGTLINASRNLALKGRNFVEVATEERQQLAKLIAVFATTLRDHLRRINDLKRVPGFEDLDRTIRAIHPESLPRGFTHSSIRGGDAVCISDQMTRMFDIEARILMEVCGGCEKILNTRLAVSYRVFVNTCVLLYVLTLPWGLVEDFVIWTDSDGLRRFVPHDGAGGRRLLGRVSLRTRGGRSRSRRHVRHDRAIGERDRAELTARSQAARLSRPSSPAGIRV